MRIIAGKFKGLILSPPNKKITRPLKDRAREGIFNLLAHSSKILFQFEKSNILDLYAGSGSFGLECLSRLALRVCFVENEKEIINILNENIERLKVKKNINIIYDDVFNFLKNQNNIKLKYNLVFLDPPFKSTNIEKIIQLIYINDIITKDAILILHRNKETKENLPSYFNIIEERVYGISKIIFGKFLF